MKRKIYIDEQQIQKVTNLLTENWAETKQKIVRKTLRVLKEILPDYTDEELSNMERELLRRFFHGRDASNPKLRPLEPLIAKILYGELNYQSKFMYDKFGLFELKKVFRNIKTLANNGIKPEAVINDTLESLAKRFGTKGEDLEKFGISKENVQKTYDKENYEYIEIEDFEQAAEYGKYTNPDGELCYTQDEDTWNSEDYSNDGTNTCYLFLRKGWKNERPVDGEDSPYDDYGLSMIWIFVSPEGEIVTSNTRWNHHNENNLPPGRVTDYSFNETEILDITGYDVNELDSDNDTVPDFLEKTEELKRRINSGMNVREACNGIVDSVVTFGDGILVLSIGNNSTFVKDGQFLYPNFWVYVYYMKKILKLFSGKACNIMFSDGSLLVNDNLWFDNIKYVPKTKIFITSNKKGSNIVDLNGRQLLKKPADETKTIYSYDDGQFASYDNFLNVRYDKNWYLYSFEKNDFVTQEPSLKHYECVSNSKWFSFKEESGGINLIDQYGKKMYEQSSFTWISGRFTNGLMEVSFKGLGKNVINRNGEFMFDKDADLDYNFEGFGEYGLLCKANGKFCVINENHGIMLLTDVVNEIIKNPENLSSMGDDIMFETTNGIKIICVKYSYEYIKNVMNGNTVICDDWFKSIQPSIGKAIITCNSSISGGYNIMRPNGTLVFNTEASSIEKWKDNYIIAKFVVTKGWRETDVSYAIVNAKTLEIEHSDIEDVSYNKGEENPIPVRFKGYSNYIKPEGGLLNNIKYHRVDYFNEHGWAKTMLNVNGNIGFNVVFKDGSVLSNELYKRILGGGNDIIAVEKEEDKENLYLVEVPTRKEYKYTYDMFPYLYKKGLGDVIASSYADDELDGLNLTYVGIKQNPLDQNSWRTPVCIGYNFVDFNTKDFVLPKFYQSVDTKDGKIFVVWDNKRYDVIDRNGNSLLGGRNPEYVTDRYTSVGAYRVDFLDDNGQRYVEYYDENFRLIKRVQDEE